ncbi:MAG: hypothetical protein LBH28_00195 [Oscillospiraceae bacterium]|nr:hypothetical protein [Oscillospiraceae bacterium]
MVKRGAVILVGYSALIGDDAVRALEDAGYMVVRTHEPDYALAANELFSPRAVLLDARLISGDNSSFFRSLLSRPDHPTVFLLDEEKTSTGEAPPGVFTMRSPFSAAELVARMNRV